MDMHGFIREVYASATPAVDFDRAEQITPWEHTIPESKYSELVAKYAQSDDERFACAMWELNSGPSLIL